MRITKDEIFQVAEALDARGLTVTNVAVREALGGRGSFSTLAPHLRAWHEARAAARREERMPVPSEVGSGWTRTLESLWATALAEARCAVQAEHDAQTAALHADLAGAHAEIARLEAEGQRREEERAAAVARADAEQVAALELRTELGAARERAAAAEARAAEETRRREAAEGALGQAREEAAELRGMVGVLRNSARV
jgi:hypothetical protein